MAYTGFVICTILEEVYADTLLPTGLTKPNIPSDPDYVPPQYRPDICQVQPTPSPTPSPTPPPSVINIVVDANNYSNQGVTLDISVDNQLIYSADANNFNHQVNALCTSPTQRNVEISLVSNADFNSYIKVFKGGVDVTTSTIIYSGGQYDNGYIVNFQTANLLIGLTADCPDDIEVVLYDYSYVLTIQNFTNTGSFTVEFMPYGQLTSNIIPNGVTYGGTSTALSSSELIFAVSFNMSSGLLPKMKLFKLVGNSLVDVTNLVADISTNDSSLISVVSDEIVFDNGNALAHPNNLKIEIKLSSDIREHYYLAFIPDFVYLAAQNTATNPIRIEIYNGSTAIGNYETLLGTFSSPINPSVDDSVKWIVTNTTGQPVTLRLDLEGSLIDIVDYTFISNNNGSSYNGSTIQLGVEDVVEVRTQFPYSSNRYETMKLLIQ